MESMTNNKGINKLITSINSDSILDTRESNRIKKMISDAPASEDIHLLRDFFYNELLNAGKSILKLEKVLANEKYLKQEKRLNIYKAIKDGTYNFVVARWAYLLELIGDFDTFYDYIKNIGMYTDLEDKNAFYYNLNKFIVEENFDFNTYNVLMVRKDNPYPSNQVIRTNYKKQKYKSENCTNELGLYGELCSHLFLKQELTKNGLKDLANRSIWVARDIGDFFGFDETSFNNDGEEIILEVKATNSPKFDQEKDSFYMTKNEFVKMNALSKEYNYYVVRVFIHDQSMAELYYLSPNEDCSIEYGDIKYVPKRAKSGENIQFERVPKKKVFKLD